MAFLRSLFAAESAAVLTHHHHISRHSAILKLKHHSLLLFICVLSVIFSGCCSDQSVWETGQRIDALADNDNANQRLNATGCAQATKAANLHTTNVHNGTAATRTLVTPVTGPTGAPDCPFNRKYSELFCQLGVRPPNKKVANQIRLILAKFDEKNDDHILGDFAKSQTETQLDRRAALTISRVIKTFFRKHFCVIVGKMMKSVEKKELDEVRTPIAKMSDINSHMNRLLVSLEHMNPSKHFQPKLLALMRDRVHSLHEAGEKAIKELYALEKSLVSDRLATSNELFYFQTNILSSLVDMFFTESVIRQSGNILVANLPTDICLNSKSVSRFAQADIECAFRFLFNSSDALKRLITHNFEYEEKQKYGNGRSKGTHQGKLVAGLRVNSTCGCNRKRSIRSQVQENACHLMEEIENQQKCYISLENYNHDCLKQCIIAKFPEVRYHNKLLMGLESGGYRGLLHALRSFCRGQSAFITFSLIDVGAYFQSIYPFNVSNISKPKQITKPTSAPQLTKTTKAVHVSVKNLAKTTKSVFSVNPLFFPTQQTISQPQMINSARQQYIIQSIVAYFLRATEQRLNCIRLKSQWSNDDSNTKSEYC